MLRNARVRNAAGVPRSMAVSAAVAAALASLLITAPAYADEGDPGDTEVVVVDGSNSTWEEAETETTLDASYSEGEEQVDSFCSDDPDVQCNYGPNVVQATWRFVTASGCVLEMSHEKSLESNGYEVHTAASTTPSTGACSPDKQKPRTLTRLECFNKANVNVLNSPTSVYQGFAGSVINFPRNAYSYCDSIHRITYNGMRAPSDWGNITFKLRVFADNAVQVWRCTDAGKCVQAA